MTNRTKLAALGLVAACGACLAFMTGLTMADVKECKQVTVTDKDNNSKQKLTRGDLLVVHLDTQPGTGFSWAIGKRDKDQLTLLSKVILENPSMIPGGKTVQLFTFRAATVGTSNLELNYTQPFEKDKDKAPAKTFKVTVTISEE